MSGADLHVHVWNQDRSSTFHWIHGVLSFQRGDDFDFLIINYLLDSHAGLCKIDKYIVV